MPYMDEMLMTEASPLSCTALRNRPCAAFTSSAAAATAISIAFT